MFFSWRKSFRKDSLLSAKKQKPIRKRKTQLQVETLEDRVTPVAFTTNPLVLTALAGANSSNSVLTEIGGGTGTGLTTQAAPFATLPANVYNGTADVSLALATPITGTPIPSGGVFTVNETNAPLVYGVFSGITGQFKDSGANAGTTPANMTFVDDAATLSTLSAPNGAIFTGTLLFYDATAPTSITPTNLPAGWSANYAAVAGQPDNYLLTVSSGTNVTLNEGNYSGNVVTISDGTNTFTDTFTINVPTLTVNGATGGAINLTTVAGSTNNVGGITYGDAGHLFDAYATILNANNANLHIVTDSLTIPASLSTQLNINTTTGILSIVATPLANQFGTYGLQSVTISDGLDQTTVTFSITLLNPVQFSTSLPNDTLPDAEIGSAYNQTVSITGGGVSASTFTLNPGYNSGITGMTTAPVLTATGPNTETATMTETAAQVATQGSATFTVHDVDEASVVSSQSYTVNVDGALTMTPSTGATNGFYALPQATQGTYYSQTITVSGGSGSYVIVPNNTGLSGSSMTSAAYSPTTSTVTLSGTPTAPGNYSFYVAVTDSAGYTFNQTYTLHINAPLSMSPATPVSSGYVVLPAAVVGTLYSSQVITVSGGTTNGSGYPVVQVGLVSSGSGITQSDITASAAGIVTVSAITPVTAGITTFPVTVTDVNGATLTVNYEIVVYPAPAMTSTLPNWTVHVPYSQTVTATAGSDTFHYSITSGSLPTSLSLNATNGHITGTPTVVATSNFTITATDQQSGATIARSYTLAINSPLVITTTSLASWTVNQPLYSQTFATTNGTSPLSYNTITGLPPGLTWTPYATSGTITGTPTQVGTYTVSISGFDGAGAAFNENNGTGFQLIINPALQITTVSLPSWTENEVYPVTTLTHTGGTAPLTFTATGLPAGMNLSTSGVLTGDPSQNGTFGVTVTATDASNYVATANYSLVIAAPTVFTLSSTTLPSWTINAPGYATQITTTGGTAPLVFTTTANLLPPGLSMTSSGLISGTPTMAGSFSFPVTVNDGANDSIEESLSITINPVLSLTPSLPAGQAGVAYNQTIHVFNGTTPLSELNVNGVTAGNTVNLTANGVQGLSAVANLSAGTIQVSGTPTIVGTGTATFTVFVEDAASTTLTKTYTINLLSGVVSQLVTALGTISATATATAPYTTTPGGNPLVGTPFSFYVIAEDRFGNVVTDVPYTDILGLSTSDSISSFSATSFTLAQQTPPVLIGGNSAFTFAPTSGIGFEQFYGVLGAAGPQTITASDSSNATVTPGVANFTVTSGTESQLAVAVTSWTPPGSSNVTGSVYTGPSNYVQFTVTAEDQFGNPVSSGDTVNLSSLVPGAVLSTTSSFSSTGTSFSLTGGVATLYAYFTQATAAENLAAQDASFAGSYSLASTFSVNAGPLAQFSVSGAYNPSGPFTGSPLAGVTAGSVFAFTVTAEDQYGNPITNFVDSAGHTFTAQEGITPSGLGTNSATFATSYNLVTGTLFNPTAAFSFGAGSPGKVTLYGILTGATSGQYVDAGMDLDVNNSLGLAGGTVAEQATSATTFNVNPGTATQLALSNEDYNVGGTYSASYAIGTTPTPTITAGTAMQFTVSAEDRFGNIATSYGNIGSFRVSSPDPSDTFYTEDPSLYGTVSGANGQTVLSTGSYTFNAAPGGDAGQHTFYAVLGRATPRSGNSTVDIVVSDNSVPPLPAVTTGPVSIVAGTQPQFTFDLPSAAVNNETAGVFVPVQVETTDGYSNIITAYPGSTNLTMNLGSIVPNSGTAVAFYSTANLSSPLTSLTFTNGGTGISPTFYAYFTTATSGNNYTYMTGTGPFGTNNSNAINVVAAAPTQLVVVPGSETYTYQGVAGNPWNGGSVPAGAVMQFTVQAEDQFGNVATANYGHSVSMSIASLGYTGYTFYTGMPGLSTTSTITAAHPYSYTFGALGGHLANGLPLDNGVHTFFAVMTKATANPVAITVTDPYLTHPSVTTDSFTVTSGVVYKLATTVLNSQAVNPNGGSSLLNLDTGSAGFPSLLTQNVTLGTTTAVSSTSFSTVAGNILTFTVTAEDIYGNVVTDPAFIDSIPMSIADATDPNARFSTDDTNFYYSSNFSASFNSPPAGATWNSGVATLYAQMGQLEPSAHAQTQALVANDGTTPGVIPGTSQPFTVTSATPFEVNENGSFSAPNQVQVGQAMNLSLQGVVDAFGNLSTGTGAASEITFTVTPSAGYNGSFTFNSTHTDSITVPTSAGLAKVVLATNAWTATTDTSPSGPAGLYDVTATGTYLGLTTTVYTAIGGLTVTGTQSNLVFEQPNISGIGYSPLGASTYGPVAAGTGNNYYVQVTDATQSVGVTPLTNVIVTLRISGPAGTAPVFIGSNGVPTNTLTSTAYASGNNPGLAAFNNVVIDDANPLTGPGSAGWTLTATSSPHLASASTALSVTATTAAKLVMSAPTKEQAGAAFNVTATVEDQYNNPVPYGEGLGASANPDYVNLTPDNNGGIDLDGFNDPVPMTVGANGVATFSGLSLTMVSTYSLMASLLQNDDSTPEVNPVTLNPITAASNLTITSGPVNQLVMTQIGISPSNTINAGTEMTFYVTPEDQFGNVCTSSMDNFRLSLNFGALASGDLVSTSPTLSNPIMTPTGTVLFNPGTPGTPGYGTETFYAVFATTSATQGGALQNITVKDTSPTATGTAAAGTALIPGGFTVLSGQVAYLTISQVQTDTQGTASTVGSPGTPVTPSGTNLVSGSGTVAAGSEFQFVVTEFDKYHNQVDNPQFENVQFSLVTSDLSAEFSTDNTSAFVAGTDNGATYYSFSSFGSGNPPQQINASTYQFGQGNEAINGQQTFYGILGLADVGGVPQTLQVSDITGGAPVTSGAFKLNVTALAATTLSIQVPRVAVQNGATFGVTVTATDPYGNPGLFPAGDTITLNLATGGPVATGSFSVTSPSITLTGSQSSVSFTGLTLPTAQGYSITASDSDLGAAVTSATFNVAGPATQISFSAPPPANVTENTTINQITAQLEDANGNIVYTGQQPVILTIYSAATGLQVGPAYSALVNGLGVASFTNVSVPYRATNPLFPPGSYYAVASFTAGGNTIETYAAYFTVNSPTSPYGN